MAVIFCYPNLTTGADDGSDLANAYQSFADAQTAASAGDEIRIPEGTYNEMLLISKPGTAYNNRITWRVCDPVSGDALTYEQIMQDDRFAVIDAESTLDHCVGITNGSFVTTMGIDGINSVSYNWYFAINISYDFHMPACGAANGSRLVEANPYTRGLLITGGKYRNGSGIGLYTHEGVVIDRAIITNCPTAIRQYRYNMIRNCIIVGSTSEGIYITSGITHIVSNVFYNCADALRIQADYHAIINNRFVGNTTAINVQSAADVGVDLYENAYYDNGTKYDTSAGGEIGVAYCELDMSGHGMIDPAGGNYQSNPATDESRNREVAIDGINTVYLTAGIQPESGSGGGGSPYHFRPGQARGPVTH